MRFLSNAAVGILAVLAIPCGAKAELLKYDFTATASSAFIVGENAAVWPSLLEGGDDGRTISGYFVVDTILASANTASGWADGYGSVVDFGLTLPLLNGRSFSSGDRPPRINYALSEDHESDRLFVRAPLTGSETVRYASLDLYDWHGTAFDGFYPAGVIDVSAFEFRELALFVCAFPSVDFKVVNATITSLTGTAVAVPEAGQTLLLFGAMVAGLLARRFYSSPGRTMRVGRICMDRSVSSGSVVSTN